MSLEHLELRDPQQLLEELEPTISYVTTGVWIVLVHRPTTAQRVVAVHRLPDIEHELACPLDPDTDEGYQQQRRRSDLLADLMRSSPIPPREPRRLTTIAVTVVVRAGRNHWGPLEKAWAMAWRYSNHLTDAIDTDFLTVTEHGWSSHFLREGGVTPHLRLAASA